MAEISPAAVVAAAEDSTGLGDFAGDEWRDALGVLTDALTAEAGLTEFGEVVAQSDLIGSLTRRLQIVEHRRTHPQVAEMRIERPVFIVGQVRTGTTILYELLAQDPDARAPLTWEVCIPSVRCRTSPPPVADRAHRPSHRGQPSDSGDDDVDHPRAGGCSRVGRLRDRRHRLIRSPPSPQPMTNSALPSRPKRKRGCAASWPPNPRMSTVGTITRSARRVWTRMPSVSARRATRITSTSPTSL